ncbi:MAG: hypothetical protein KGL29_07985 [Alphaproteobacteria bacterium]|nr:hypothetical protein [Alphaproteobacteria bacterium]MDE2164382.1 hypothetical protein [Alphaproteobacteria bacterium]MDE2265822.1 hypothetical protein [Alphaproteobacteria bacterium]
MKTWLGLLAVAALWPAVAQAQTDEIQVYDATIARPGVFNLTLHDNYTPSGRKVPDFAGGLVPDHTLNGVPEWAYGVTDWFEAGLYAPLYSVESNGNVKFNGMKLRALFVSPDAADRTFFYGINFEFSYNSTDWDPKRFTSEIRPIIGWHLGKVDLIFNPILDNSYDGFSRLDFAPSTRVAYHVSNAWAVALEEYDDFGPLRHFYSGSQQSHQLFAVVDYSGEPVSVETGIGFGMTPASDNMVLKLILSRDLN